MIVGSDTCMLVGVGVGAGVCVGVGVGVTVGVGVVVGVGVMVGNAVEKPVVSITWYSYLTISPVFIFLLFFIYCSGVFPKVIFH